MATRLGVACVLAVAIPALGGCKAKPKNFTTTVEVIQVRSFGGSQGQGKLTDLELKFSECPGNARQVMRAGREFGACGEKLKAGDKIKAEVVLSYNAERGNYRNDITHLGDCDVKLDPKDEANYQMVEDCSDVQASGVVVGVRCERGRSDKLLAACPFLRRN